MLTYFNDFLILILLLEAKKFFKGDGVDTCSIKKVKDSQQSEVKGPKVKYSVQAPKVVRSLSLNSFTCNHFKHKILVVKHISLSQIPVTKQ